MSSTPTSIFHANNLLKVFERDNSELLSQHAQLKSSLREAITSALTYLSRNPTYALRLANHRYDFDEHLVFDADGYFPLKGWLHDENTLSVMWQERWTEGQSFEVRYSLLDIPFEYTASTN